MSKHAVFVLVFLTWQHGGTTLGLWTSSLCPSPRPHSTLSLGVQSVSELHLRSSVLQHLPGHWDLSLDHGEVVGHSTELLDLGNMHCVSHLLGDWMDLDAALHGSRCKV